MDIREKLEREIKRVETLKTQCDNMHGNTARSIICRQAIVMAWAAINTDSKLFMADSLKELQTLE